MNTKKEWPASGDMVVIKIKRVNPFGATVDLLEYPGKEGFIHISNVANSWVKNIRSFVSEGQVRVASTMRVDPNKNSIDLSLRKVSSQQEKRKMSDYKRENRACKIFENLCTELKDDPAKTYEEVAKPLIDEFGDLYSVFENIKINSPEVLNHVNISDKWKKALIEYTDQFISIPEVHIKGILSITSNDPDGSEIIKKALISVKAEDVKLTYISAPRYGIDVSAPDYPTAEIKIDESIEKIVNLMESNGGEASFERIKS